MTEADKVRASRAGDRYHYFWASRRALRLLDFESGLQVVSIEGAQDSGEFADDEIIDVGEYYGGDDLATCERLRVTQLKYSSLRTDKEITSSELENTLKKFANSYRQVEQDGHGDKVEFDLVTNRRLNERVRTSLTEITAGAQQPTHPNETRLLRRYLGFDDDIKAETAFCRRLSVTDGESDIESVEGALREEFSQFIPGGGAGSETALLMDKIARIASTPSASHRLDRADLLLTLHCSAEDLFPAPSKIETMADAVETDDVTLVVDLLAQPSHQKLLLTAVGGVGKSVLTNMLKDRLDQSADSVTVIYDCFASGDYRKQSSIRHPHHIGLTQIVNEIAGRGLCMPLVPARSSDAGDFMRAFMRKIRQVAKQLEGSDALLTIIVDAADNAVVGANLFGGRTFVGDLFREEWPGNARLIGLCRPERRASLDLPGDVEVVPLTGFREPQTLTHLHARFPDATSEEGAHLHALSGGNPRVQAMALEHAISPDEAIASLEQARAGLGDTLDTLLQEQIRAIADAGHLSNDEVERLCQALASLHPAVPVDVLAALSGLHADAVRSFTSALGRGLYLDHDAVQFRDEPTETWFRTAHALAPARRREFASELAELAERVPYAALALPQAYFEADMLEELVELALSDRRIPGDVPEVQRKQIASARVRFALAAALRGDRHLDAALLSIRAGELSGGEERRLTLYRTYPDLAGRFLERDAVETLCSGRDLATDWPGSNLHVEAVLLARIGAADDARSRFQSAFNNALAISRLDSDERDRIGAELDAKMAADMAVAVAIVDGPARAADFTGRWRSADRRREITQHLARRLADLGHENHLSDLVTETDRIHVQIGAFETMYGHGIVPNEAATRQFLDRVLLRTRPLKPLDRTYGNSDVDDRAVVWALLHGLRMSLISEEQALGVLDVHLPAHLSDHVGESWGATSPISSLLGYALRARLEHRELRLADVASEKIRKASEVTSHISRTRSVESFLNSIPRLLPWARLLVDVTLDGPSDSIASQLRDLGDSDLKTPKGYETPQAFAGSVAELATRILALAPDDDLTQRLAEWLRGGVGGSRLPTIRNAARSPHLASIAIQLANQSAEAAEQDDEFASELADTLAELALAIYGVSEDEAAALFDQADTAAELLGDDLYERWRALTRSATSLRAGNQPARAYRLFQIGEALNRTSRIGVHDLAEPLYALDPSSYFGLASRARDRRSLSLSRLLEPIVNMGLRDPAQVGGLAAYAFGGQTPWRQLGTSPEAAITPAAQDVMAHYARFEHSPDDLPKPKYRSLGTTPSKKEEERADLLKELHTLNFRQSESWDVLFDKPLYGDDLQDVLAVVLGLNPVALPAVINAAADAARATERHLFALAKVAGTMPPTAGMLRALGKLAMACTERFPRDLCAQDLGADDLLVLAEVTGVPIRDLRYRGFRSLSGVAYQLKPGEYFTVAAQLAQVLDQEERGKVFDALTHLFDDVAPATTTSDGPYSAALAPQSGAAAGLAGLIWTALGDPGAERRWQAAHAVLLLVQLGAGDVLQHLAGFADGTHDSDAYRDARFPAYDLHSAMWLLLALDRSAHEPNAPLLKSFIPWLAGVVSGQRHAANQVLAQRTLKTLSNVGTELPEDGARALAVDVWPRIVEMNWRDQKKRPDPLAAEKETDESHRYPFFLDFRPYWCNTLARAFGSSEEAVAEAAFRMAATVVGYEDDRSERDPRHVAGVFGSDRRRGESTYASHGAWPEDDDFDTYAAVHALLTLGAELAQAHAALKEDGADEDTYTEWLSNYLPTHRGGRWLSDRRDPSPLPAPEVALTDRDPEGWRWSISPADFAAIAGHGTEWVTIHSDTYVGSGRLSQEANVMSALVPNETAASLLVTLQTNPAGPWSVKFPTDGDLDPGGHFLTDPPYALTPWLDTISLGPGIDEYDGHGRNVTVPPTRLNRAMVERFGLTSDEDMRVWRADGEEVIQSRMWNDAESNGEYETGNRGEILQIRSAFLARMLSSLDQTLVLQVDLRRDLLDQHRYGREDDDELRTLERSHKVYVISPDGRWTEY